MMPMLSYSRSILCPLLLTIMTLCFVQCKTENTTEVANNTTEKKDLSGDGISTLYQYYVENPQNQDHIDENMIIDHVVASGEQFERTRSGLYYKILEEGSGNNYVYGGPCTSHYKGYFLDGRVFDSSYPRGNPISFKIGQMNAAWNEILQRVNPGTKLKIIVPSRLGYGERGFPGYVPPNTIIAFDIETIAP